MQLMNMFIYRTKHLFQSCEEHLLTKGGVFHLGGMFRNSGLPMGLINT